MEDRAEARAALSPEARIDAAIRAEGRRRLGVVTAARVAAMVAVAALVAVIAPYPDHLWYHALIGVFIVFGLAQFAIGRSAAMRVWMIYVFIAADLALLVFTLIYPNPLSDRGFPPQFFLRFGTFSYLYLVLTALAMSLRPSLPLWGGICGAAFWSIGVAWLASLPGSKTAPILFKAPEAADVAALSLDPAFIDLDLQMQNVAIFLIVAATLSLATTAARRLLARETASARRAANLSRYLPAEKVAALEGRDNPFEEERDTHIAILFTDIVGFSTFAETRDAHEVIGALTDAHALVEAAVFDHHGALDKFIGDGAMATFGAAGADGRAGTADHAADAVACARAILARADLWNDDRRAQGAPPIRIVIGLHFGPVVVGDVGSARRMELAVIGDAVNVAARLEAMTRALALDAAISAEALAAAGIEDPEAAGFMRMGPQPVPGRAEPVVVWGL